MKCAGRSVPWLCPPVAMGSTWSAVKLILCGYLSVLSIGSLHNQHVRLGCASSLARLRLYSGSLVRDLLWFAIVACLLCIARLECCLTLALPIVDDGFIVSVSNLWDRVNKLGVEVKVAVGCGAGEAIPLALLQASLD